MRSNRRATAEAVTECARNIYQEARDWYKVAETKAQILLALDGAAITAISAAVFGKPGEVKAFVAELPWQSTAALCLSALAFVASVFCAVVCVWSVVYTKGELDKITGRPGSPDLRPDNLWFFQFHTRHDPQAVLDALMADRLAEARSLLGNLPILGKSVARKHKAVNLGFALASVAVILLLWAAALFVVGAAPPQRP